MNTTQHAVKHITAFGARLRDPGFLYNLGNVICLAAGVTATIIASSARDVGDRSLAAHIFSFFVGSPAATLISLATLSFFVGGMAYSKAWQHGLPPDPAQNRKGDIYSGIGAAFFGAGMMLIGNPLLALSGGLMHALGKFGSAAAGDRTLGFASRELQLRSLCKDLVLLSRFPAILSALTGAASALLSFDIATLLLPISAVICCLFWMLADFHLLSPDGVIRRSL
jgi:hypothetical protein